MFDQLDKDNLASKTKFLESEIEEDRHYCVKLFPSQIYNCEDYREWLYNFYKDKNVYYLQRQNKWEQFLSYTYQQKTGWEHPNPKINEISKIEKQKIRIDKSDVELWLDIYNRDFSLDLSKFDKLQKFDYEAMDLSTEYVRMRDYIDYESVIENAGEYKWMIL